MLDDTKNALLGKIDKFARLNSAILDYLHVFKRITFTFLQYLYNYEVLNLYNRK